MAIVSNPVYKTSDGNIDYSKYVPGLELRYNQILQRISNSFGGGASNPGMLSGAEAQRARFVEYINNPNSEKGLAYEKSMFEDSINSYGYYASRGNTTEADKYKQAVEKQVPYLVNFRNIPVKDIQTELDTNINKGIETAKKITAKEKKASEGTWFDKMLGLVAAVGWGVATGGIGSSLAAEIGVSAAVGDAIVSASLGLIQGKSPEDIVKGIIGSVAANEVAGALKGVNAQIAAAGPNFIAPEVASALVNAERQVVSAAITGQDIGKAALAGAAGGAVASASSLATDSAAIQRAAGEYVQALAAGKTQEQALTSALSGFINQQEKDAAQQKVLDEAAKNPDLAKLEGNQVGALTGDQAGGTTGDPTNSLPPVTVTADQELPVQESVGSYTGTEQGELSLQNKALQTDTKSQPKTSKTNNAILLSLINKPLSRSVSIGSPTQTSSTVGSQALGQALRVGDAGAPVFGGDKDKSKRSGWNTESLRYMGNSGDSNG